MKQGYSAVLACVGAVIGAGFASGREVVVFFTQYGRHAWWLIVFAALVMTALCMLCMCAAKRQDCCDNWCGLLQGRWAAQGCSFGLMVITAGAMTAAAGHMLALLLAFPRAYEAGVLGTILAAWGMGFGSLKPLNLLGAALTLALLCALMAVLVMEPHEPTVLLQQAGDAKPLAAFIRAAGYAAMNMMLAIGVICRSAAQTQRIPVVSGLFGWLIMVLLLIAQCVYVRHPEALQQPFPMLELLSRYGRKGYLFTVVLLYLSIITTLASVLCGLRMQADAHVQRGDARLLVVLGLPLAVSGVGFAEIVDRLYAPAGLVCLALVFAPLAVRECRARRSQVLS